MQPQNELHSGSEASLVEWDSLGVQGRNFAGEGRRQGKRQGPTAEDIERFSGEPAEVPIRVYVGLRSADSLADRVDLAMQELERTNAFDREVLAVYATTGTGWIDERVADSFEYIWGGDTAAVGLQYSYLPSWISVLVDAEKAADASTEMIAAVEACVSEMPEGDRPRVDLFGESLGSFATESAFEDLDDLVTRTDGALLVGPTFGNDLRHHLTTERDEGSPEWRPVFEEGRQVRFAVEPDDFEHHRGPWEEPRIAFLQNSSDPISHFRFDLLWARPGLVRRTAGPDANPDMLWFPGGDLLADTRRPGLFVRCTRRPRPPLRRQRGRRLAGGGDSRRLDRRRHPAPARHRRTRVASGRTAGAGDRRCPLRSGRRTPGRRRPDMYWR